MKKIFKKILRFLDNNIGFIEGFIILNLILNFARSTGEDKAYILLIIPIYMLWVNIKYKIKSFISYSNLKYISNNHRTIKFDGGQGEGKTSMMCLFALITKRPVYSITPLKLNGDFCYKLTYDHLILKKKLKEKGLLIVDEMTLLFNNLQKSKTTEYSKDLYSIEILIQLIRHFIDGGFCYASVVSDRAEKVLREKITYRIQMLGQTTVRNSWIIGPFLNIFSKWKWHGTFRVWNMQTYNQIKEEGYIYDLSNDETNTKNNRFANLLQVVVHNNKDFEYNDRYLKSLYEALNIDYDDVKFDSLDMDMQTVKDQYQKIYEFLLLHRGLDENQIKKEYK